MLKLLFLSVAIVVLSETLPTASAANIRGMSIRDQLTHIHILVHASDLGAISDPGGTFMPYVLPDGDGGPSHRSAVVPVFDWS